MVYITSKYNIDCGDNKELYNALSSFKTRTDRFQWFICKEEYISTHTMNLIPVGTWQLNTAYNRLPYHLKKLWKKATIKEIVEHFSR